MDFYVVERFVRMASNTHALITALTDVGLNDKEAAVYLACLSLGPCRIADLAHAAGLKRTTVYSIVEGLLHQGVLTTELRGMKKLTSAIAPEMLETVLARRLSGFRASLPRLQALYNVNGEERAIRSYEGAAAIETLYEELLSRARVNEFYYAMTDYDAWMASDPEFFADFVKRRSRKRLDLRILFCESASARLSVKHPDRVYESIRFLPARRTISTNLVVTPHCAVIHQLTPPVMAIAFETKQLIQMQKEVFEILWDESGETLTKR